ncbi:hypothetical protein PGT21_023696 [Puccinia graminis f. sp. tritici]|uniref:Uncharacterized protein n=1 Tax=Puccinia graminis f. sp. tritici TaxID=56615 RepID=A0A5B0LRK1_PUCGR|nr:hypothetical protein PGT21_023696 [Puccinia graminis f. sp. tritici]KAA1072643.1 hypothetical protein PGTUg99_007301 [Puccinia graminis f. sp. tritici]
MVDRQTKCALCRAPPPPLTERRKKYLARLGKVAPPEDPDEVAARVAAEIIQTELDLRQNAPELVSSGNAGMSQPRALPPQDHDRPQGGASPPRSSNFETRTPPAPSHGGPHHRELAPDLGGAEFYNEDEATALAIFHSLNHDAPQPFRPENSMYEHGNPSSQQDTSEENDLAVAIALQEEFNREHQGGAAPEHTHAVTPEMRNTWSGPDTNQDEEFARQIHRQLNEQGSPWTEPIPQRRPQSTPPAPPAYPRPMPQAYPPQGYPVHASSSGSYPGGPAYPRGYPADGGPNQRRVGRPTYYPRDYQSMGGSSGAFETLQRGATDLLQRGVDHFIDDSLIQKISDSMPQLIIAAGLVLYFLFYRTCSDCAK